MLPDLDPSKIFDGIFVAFGLLIVWAATIVTASIIRSISTAGGMGLVHVGKMAGGWWRYVRGDDGDIVNITLNTISNQYLKMDTLVSDRHVKDVWPNVYLARRIRRAARACTMADPVVHLKPNGHGLFHRAVKAPKNDDHRALYGPLISLIAEACTNQGSIDLAIGRPMREFRFVVALTFEQTADHRLRHLRAMVISEDEILRWPWATAKLDAQLQLRRSTMDKIAQQYQLRPQEFGIVNVWRPE